MTAPVLVMVTRGSADPSVAQVAHELRQGLRRLRPEIQTHCAFVDQNPPSLSQILDQVIADGVGEVALVPMQLTHAVEGSLPMEELMAKAHARFPSLRLTLSRPAWAGVEPAHHSRSAVYVTALSQARCLELDGLVPLLSLRRRCARHFPAGAPGPAVVHSPSTPLPHRCRR